MAASESITRPLSATSLKVANCLRAYDARYNHHIRDDSDAARRGRLFHDCHRRYVLKLIAAGVRTDWTLADDAFAEAVCALNVPIAIADEVQDLFLNRYVSGGFELDVDAAFTVEEPLVDAVVGGRTARWIPDLTYVRPTEVRTIDLKTAWASMTKDAAERDEQVLTYGRLMMERWPGFPVYVVELVFVRTNLHVEVSFTPEDIPRLDRWLDLKARAIDYAHADNSWPAQPGDACRFCRLACDAVDDPRLLPVRFLTEDEARRGLGEVSILRQREKALLSAGAAWVAMNGPVETNGLEWRHRETIKREYPADATLAVLRDYGVQALPRALIPSKAMTKYRKAKKWAAVNEALEQDAVVQRTSTEFSAKKVGAEIEAEEE